MSLYVVDASIAVKLYIPEVHSAEAIRFFSDGHELIVPEFMLAEVANVIWKKAALLSEISETEAVTLSRPCRSCRLAFTIPRDYWLML